ncbi:MAG: helix-turn-helix transcriptional regulator [Pseudomonadota bacterium]
MADTTSIPVVEFAPTQTFGGDFELIELDSLYERSDQLDIDPFSPHRINFHHLVYIAEGRGAHTIDFHAQPFRAGSFIFANRHQVNAFDRDHRPRGYILLFTQDFVDSIRTHIRFAAFNTGFHSESFAPVLTVEGRLKASCETLLLELSKERDEQGDGTVTKLLFSTLMVKLHRYRPASTDGLISEHDQQRFARFMELVQSQFSTSKDASGYAESLGLSYKTLNKLCKQMTQKTPKQLIDAHIILEAKRRLAIERIKVSQLAYQFGFDDVSNFVKYFKKHAGFTPSQFQREIA